MSHFVFVFNKFCFCPDMSTLVFLMNRPFWKTCFLIFDLIWALLPLLFRPATRYEINPPNFFHYVSRNLCTQIRLNNIPFFFTYQKTSKKTGILFIRLRYLGLYELFYPMFELSGRHFANFVQKSTLIWCIFQHLLCSSHSKLSEWGSLGPSFSLEE